MNKCSFEGMKAADDKAKLLVKKDFYKCDLKSIQLICFCKKTLDLLNHELNHFDLFPI